MDSWIFIVVLLGVLVLVIGVFAIIMTKKQKELLKKCPGYPKGYFMGQGMGIGIAIGAGMGVVMGNIAIGVGLGVRVGVAIGSAIEEKHKDEIRPPTEEEKALKKQKMIFAVSLLTLGVLVGILVYFLNS